VWYESIGTKCAPLYVSPHYIPAPVLLIELQPYGGSCRVGELDTASDVIIDLGIAGRRLDSSGHSRRRNQAMRIRVKRAVKAKRLSQLGT
jgi:hypothetical protein